MHKSYGKSGIDWKDPAQKRAYKREWMRRARRSQSKNFRLLREDEKPCPYVLILGIRVRLNNPPLPPV